MSDEPTINPDDLPEISEIPDELRALVFEPGGPLQAAPFTLLLNRLIATDLVKQTQAELDADLAHDEDAVALVCNDPTATANGWYRKIGASGAGNWDQFEELAKSTRAAAEAAEAAAATAATAAEAARDDAQDIADSISFATILPETSDFVSAGALDGTEFIPILQNGQERKLRLYDIVAYIQSGPEAPPSLTIADLSRPALVLAEEYNAFGDSVTNGTGAPAGFSWPEQFRARATGQTFAFDGGEGGKNGPAIEDIANGGIGSQNSIEVTARIVALASSHPEQVGRPMFYFVGLNDYNPAVAGFTRDWPTQVKGNYVTAAGVQTGGKRMFALLTPTENFNAGGSIIGADHAFHQEDMIDSFGELAFDVARYMRFRRELQAPDGTADALALAEGIIPYKYRGGASDFDGADYPIIQGAGNPTDLNYPESTIYWNSTASTPHRKIGASGAGYWEAVDRKHMSKYGYAVIDESAGDMAMAEEGTGPPFAPPAKMRVAADAANGAVVGQLNYIGVAANFALRTYADGEVTEFAVSNTGQVTKVGGAALTPGETNLVVVAQNEHGLLLSPLDIIVTKPSTQTTPELRTIAAPYVALCGRMSNGMTDGKAISGAFWFSAAALATQQLVLGSRSNSPAQPLSLQLMSNGNQRLTVYDSSGAQQIINFTTVKYAAGVPVWFVFAIDFATNTRCAYLTEAAHSVAAVTNGENLPLADASPIFLAANESRVLRPLVYPFAGDFGFGGLWDGYVDWDNAATSRRLLYDASGTPVARTPFAPVGGLVPKFEISGSLGEFLDGTPDGSNGPHRLSISHHARTVMS